MAQQLTNADCMAMGELARARRQAMVNMFSGTKLTFGAVEKVKTGHKLKNPPKR